jgi:hypothetical protein
MSHLYKNETQRNDMRDRFFCRLYHHDRNNDDNCRSVGQNANSIWIEMGDKAFGETQVPDVISDLVQLNLVLGRINKLDNGYVILTENGRNWGMINCNKIM